MRIECMRLCRALPGMTRAAGSEKVSLWPVRRPAVRKPALSHIAALEPDKHVLQYLKVVCRWAGRNYTGSHGQFRSTSSSLT